jgi:hypothetical protein
MRNLALWAAALVAMLAIAACGGSGESSVQQPAFTPKAFVSAAEAMNASADSFQAQVQSFQGTMSIGIEATGSDSFSTSAVIKYEAPDKSYVKMDIPGAGDMEVLLDLPDAYFNVDGTWYKADGDAFGIDLSELQKYAEDHGPVDYTDALKGLKDLSKLSDEQIDGKTYWHYHGALDLSKLGDEVPSDVIDPQIVDQVANSLLDTDMDVYIDPDTLLPRRYVMKMGLGFGEQSMTMNMSMDFEKYNEDVDFPDVPADAPPLSDASAFY